tara:strand:+ start:19047 stop:23006 length:3960 start_codon:yes stop_codon:yes gene_type:complete
MAAKKRVTPDVAGLGQMPQVDTSRPASYPLVSGGGGTVGTPPNWAASLTRFNKSLGNFFSGVDAKAEREGMDQLVEILKSDAVTDEEIQIEKWLKDNNKPNFLHPAVPVKVVQYAGTFQGREDVNAIVNTPEFQQYTWQELNNDSGVDAEGNEDPRDFLTKIQERIYSELPNRKYVGKTAGPNWRRGYDPAVLDAVMAFKAKLEPEIKKHSFAKAKEANINEATRVLVDALDSANWLTTVADWGRKVSKMKTTWPSDGVVNMRDDLFNVAIKSTMEAAMADVDADYDKLSKQFNALLNLKLTKPDGSRGGHIFDDVQRQEGKLLLSRMYDAEIGLQSRRRQRDEADQKYAKTVITNLFQSFPQMIEEHPKLQKMGLKKFQDLTPDNLMEVVEIVSKSGWINYDEKIMSRIAEGARVSFFNDIKDRIEANKVTDLSNESKLAANEASVMRSLIENHPQYKSALAQFDIRAYLTGTKNLDNLAVDVTNAVDTKFLKSSVLSGFNITEEAIASLVQSMVAQHTTSRGVTGASDSPAANVARQVLQDGQRLMQSGHQFTDEELQEYINVVQESFVGEKDIDDDLNKLITSIKEQQGNEQYYKHFNDVQPKLMVEFLAPTGDENAELWTEVQRWALLDYDAAVQNLPDHQRALKQFLPPVGDAEMSKKVAAASRVIQTIATDYNRVYNDVVTKWKRNAIRSGVLPDQLDDEFAGKEQLLEKEVIDRMRAFRAGYNKTYLDLTTENKNDTSISDEDARNAGFGSPAIKALHAKSQNLRLDRDMAIEQFVQDAQQKLSDSSGEGFSNLKGDESVGVTEGPHISFFEGDSSDERYERFRRIQDEKEEVEAQIISSLVTEHNKMMKYTDAEADGDDVAISQGAIEALKSQYKSFAAAYKGIPWESMLEGNAEIELPPESGITMRMPVSYGDPEISVNDTMAFKSYGEAREFEGAFNFFEQFVDGGGELVSNAGTPSAEDGLKVTPSMQMSESDKMKLERGAKVVEFARRFLDLDIMSGDPDHRKQQQEKLDRWMLRQRSIIIATDPSKLPEEENLLIKRKAVDNFIASGELLKEAKEKAPKKDFADRILGGSFMLPNNFDKKNTLMFNGVKHTPETWRKIKAIRDYNDFLYNSDFSEGLTGREALTLYAGLSGGDIAATRYDFHDGDIGSFKELIHAVMSGASDNIDSWYKRPRRKKPLNIDELTDEDRYVIAQELALADQKYRNPMNLNASYEDLDVLIAGGLEKSEVLPDPFANDLPIQIQKYLDLLQFPDTKSQELADAFRRLYDASDIGLVYGPELDTFEMKILPLPPRQKGSGAWDSDYYKKK